MRLVASDAIAQLDDLIGQWENVPIKGSSTYAFKLDPVLEVRMKAAIERLSPPGSAYFKRAGAHLLELGRVAIALRDDYKAGYLRSIGELIHADLFGDILEAAEYLLSEGWKDAAAVMIGGVLESHLRQLCMKNGIAVTVGAGAKVKPKRAEQMNNDLYAGSVYSKLEQKEVTAKLDLRNHAAHAEYGAYDKAAVEAMLTWVTNFVGNFPA